MLVWSWKKEMLHKQRKMVKNFEIMVPTHVEEVDTEDIPDFKGIFDQLKSVKKT